MDEIYKSDSGQRLSQNLDNKIDNILESYTEYPLSVRNEIIKSPKSDNLLNSNDYNHIDKSVSNKLNSAKLEV